MNADRVFFDTNILLYAFREPDAKSAIAKALVTEGGLTSVQVLNEFVAVSLWKLKRPWESVRAALESIRVLCPEPISTTTELHDSALRIYRRYGYHIYDSLVIAAALQSSSSTLYSEDLQNGQRIEGLTIRNPFR
jgi:predicted nucleic acid-binding protein